MPHKLTLAILALGAASLTYLDRLDYEAHAIHSRPTVEAWAQCALQCARVEPADNGQGCIDLECNPLLGSEEDDK